MIDVIACCDGLSFSKTVIIDRLGVCYLTKTGGGRRKEKCVKPVLSIYSSIKKRVERCNNVEGKFHALVLQSS